MQLPLLLGGVRRESAGCHIKSRSAGAVTKQPPPSLQVSDEIQLSKGDEDDVKVKALEFLAPRGQRVWVKITEVSQDAGGGVRLHGSMRAVSQKDGQDLDPGGMLTARRGPGGGGGEGAGEGLWWQGPGAAREGRASEGLWWRGRGAARDAAQRVGRVPQLLHRGGLWGLVNRLRVY